MKAKPFMKWPGSKRRSAERIASRLPAGDRLVEPFVGSGAIFMATDYPAYLLADANSDLIQVYLALQKDADSFIEQCQQLFTQEGNTKTIYLERRERFNLTTDPIERAVLFVYLNRHSFNGLVRFNRSGGFNVPFGDYRRPTLQVEAMRIFADKLRERDVTLICADFRQTLALCQRGDVVYCDPPYSPLTSTANFSAYTAGAFGPAEHAELAGNMIDLHRRGVPSVISNHDTPHSRTLYTGAQVEGLAVRRSISCKGGGRGTAPELMALYATGVAQ